MIAQVNVNKWIGFYETETQKRETKIIEVWNKLNGDTIGIIKWHPSWRHYCFFPQNETVFSERCLLAIVEYIKNLNIQHKIKKKGVFKQ